MNVLALRSQVSWPGSNWNWLFCDLIEIKDAAWAILDQR